MAKGFEDFQGFGKDGMEAAMEVAAVWNKGMQAIATEFADYSKKSFDDSSKLAENAAKVKTPEAAIAFQTTVVKTGYEGFVKQATKFGEMYMNVAKDAYAPIEKRATKAA